MLAYNLEDRPQILTIPLVSMFSMRHRSALTRLRDPKPDLEKRRMKLKDSIDATYNLSLESPDGSERRQCYEPKGFLMQIEDLTIKSLIHMQTSNNPQFPRLISG